MFTSSYRLHNAHLLSGLYASFSGRRLHATSKLDLDDVNMSSKTATEQKPSLSAGSNTAAFLYATAADPCRLPETIASDSTLSRICLAKLYIR